MRYAHANIVSRDWKKLSNFYIAVFECKIVPPIRNQSGEWLSRGTGVPNAQLEGAHLLLPGHGSNGPTLEIFQYTQMEDQEHIVPNKRGFSHIAFEVDDIAKTLEDVRAHGGTIQGDITSKEIEGAGTISFVYARDPEGNIIELQHWER